MDMDVFNGWERSRYEDETVMPPGFRFHPTDEELITYYLLKKVLDSSFSCAAISQVNLNKSEPWELPEKAKMGEKEWYFFTLRDRKYPTGLRTNRATEAGYWKATGKDREIKSSKTNSLLGMKKTLVFYKGRAPKGEKSCWVMHEYRLDGKFSYHYITSSAKERHRPSPALNTALQAAASGPRSERMNQTLKIAPGLLDVYFSVTLRDANDSLICALIPLLMARNSTMFPDKNFSHEIRRRLLEFVLAAFQKSPNFIALLKKPIIDRLGEAYDDPAKRELALQLCWAIGEYGGGGESHKEAARELFESLELLLYENLSSSRLGLRQESGNGSRRTTQSRLLCFVVTAIAKLATYHRELLPRARVALGKVVRSRISDARVWRRAHDYLGLMNEPGICWSVLGPSRVSEKRFPGTVNWSEGGDKMVAHIPFHILSEQGGPPFHDYALSDVIIKN